MDFNHCLLHPYTYKQSGKEIANHILTSDADTASHLEEKYFSTGADAKANSPLSLRQNFPVFCHWLPEGIFCNPTEILALAINNTLIQNE